MSSTSRLRVSRSSRDGRRALVGVVLGAGLLFSAAACGSDDDAPPAADGDVPTLESTADAGTDPDADSGADSGEPEQDGGGDYCAVLQQFGDDVLSGATGDPEGMGELVEVYREIAAAAPADAAADWTTMADAMETMSDIDYSDPDAADALAGLEDLGEVANRLGQQVQEECG